MDERLFHKHSDESIRRNAQFLAGCVIPSLWSPIIAFFAASFENCIFLLCTTNLRLISLLQFKNYWVKLHWGIGFLVLYFLIFYKLNGFKMWQNRLQFHTEAVAVMANDGNCSWIPPSWFWGWPSLLCSELYPQLFLVFILHRFLLNCPGGA